MTHVILALVLNLYSGSWVDPTSLLAEPRTKLVTGLNILIDSLVSETFAYSFRTALRKERFGKEAKVSLRKVMRVSFCLFTQNFCYPHTF